MSPPPKNSALPKPTLLFALALVVLYAVIMAAKLSLWRANVLMNDWSFYNNSFWNTNFRDLWMFSHDRYVVFGYPSYLNEHFAPWLMGLAALYHVVPRPELMLLSLHGASPVIAAISASSCVYNAGSACGFAPDWNRSCIDA